MAKHRLHNQLVQELKEERIAFVKSVTKKLASKEEFKKLRFFYNERIGEVEIDGISDELAEKVMNELAKDLPN